MALPRSVCNCESITLPDVTRKYAISFDVIHDFTQHILYTAVVCALVSLFATPTGTAKANFLKAKRVWSLQTGPATHSPDTWVRYGERQSAAEEISMC